MSTVDKAIPKPNDLNLEFFQAIVASGSLHLQRCAACSDFHHPPRVYCPKCFSGEYSYVSVSGNGVVYSYTISHYSTERAWKEEIPYSTVVVELDEGPRLVGSARGIGPGELKIGKRVMVTPEPVNDDFAYLWVERIEGDSDE